MVNLKPDQRPTAQHTITVLDQMVNSICETIRKNFTKEEMEQLKKGNSQPVARDILGLTLRF